MPLPGADVIGAPSSFLLAKCGSTLFCVGRSVLLWAVVLLVFLLGALRNVFVREKPSQTKKRDARIRPNAVTTDETNPNEPTTDANRTEKEKEP